MIKHASSHGLSVLICSILAALIVSLLDPLAPKLLSKVNTLSDKVVISMSLPLEAEFLSIILIAMLLAIVWGVFFKISQDRRGR